MSEFHEVGPLNVPPTELACRIKDEPDSEKRGEMVRALEAWRATQGNSLARTSCRVARAWLASFLGL